MASVIPTGVSAASNKPKETDVSLGQQAVKIQPLSKEYLEYMNNNKNVKNKRGYIPSTIDTSKFSVPIVKGRQANRKMPSSYDLRTLGRVSSIKNQGAYGLCWTFAAMASAESGLIKKYPWIDLSEKHLAWSTFGFKDGFKMPKEGLMEAGGFNQTATATMSHHYGPNSEAKFPYSEVDKRISDKDRGSADFSLKDVGYLPAYPKKVGDDRVAKSIMKKLLMDKGALSIAYKSEESTLNHKKAAWFNKNKGEADHQVTLIGWDDNYSRNNFKNKPKKNGAWLVKNSWGAAFEGHDAGTFWISYEDKTLNDGAFFQMSEAKETEKVQFHDETGWSVTLEDQVKGGKGFKGGNRFKTTENTNLTSVGIYTVDSNVKAKISVYTKSGKKWSAKLNGFETFEPYAGYHTIKLPKNIGLKKGQEYFVVYQADNTNKNKKDGLPFEAKVTKWVDASQSKIKKGQSYVFTAAKKGAKKKWVDVDKLNDQKGLKTLRNLCINAITDTAPGEIESVKTESSEALLTTLIVGDKKTTGDSLELFDTTGVTKAQDKPKAITSLKTSLSEGATKAYIWTVGSGTVKINGKAVSYKGAKYAPVPVSGLKVGDNLVDIEVSKDGNVTNYKLNIQVEGVATEGKISVPNQVGEDKVLRVNIGRAEVDRALKEAFKNGKSTGPVSMIFDGGKETKGLKGTEVIFKEDGLKALEDIKIGKLTFGSDKSVTVLGQKTFKEIVSQSNGDITFSALANEKAKLNKAAKKLVGKRRIIDYKILDNVNKEINISKESYIILALEYKNKKGEDSSNIGLYSIDKKGKAEAVISVYDPDKNGLVSFINGTGTFAVGASS